MSESKSSSAINNLINGNLTQARFEAKNIPFHYLVGVAVMQLGYSVKEAGKMADYLKRNISFEEYCNSKGE
jgi:hypothetical protein